MRGRPVPRAVALLTTIACCIALPGLAIGAAGDDPAAKKPPAKSTKSTSKSSTASKPSSKPSAKKPTSSSAKNAKGSSKSTAAKGSAKTSGKSGKATTASAKKPAPSPATLKKPASTDPGREAFDPVAPSTTTIPGAPAATASATPGSRGPTRIDFDDRLIQGQRNTAGAVYLYDRKELKQRSMIKKRESFREEIVGVVYDSEL
jgi:hypothetical protein